MKVPENVKLCICTYQSFEAQVQHYLQSVGMGLSACLVVWVSLPQLRSVVGMLKQPLIHPGLQAAPANAMASSSDGVKKAYAFKNGC